MQSELHILALPKLRVSHAKAAQKINETSHYETLFLMFPRGLEEPVKTLAEGLPYEYVISEIRRKRLIPEPFKVWEYYAEPILKMLYETKKQNPNLNIYCYGSTAYENISTETATKIAVLTLRVLATGKVDVKRWKEVLIEELKFSLEASEEEAEFVLSVAKRYRRNLCISSLSGKKLKDKVAEEKEGKIRVKLEYVNVPYQLTPLETLKNELLRELKGETLLKDEVVEKIARCHVDYVKKYILLSSNPDDAYFKWVSRESKKLEDIVGKDETVFSG